MPSTYLNGYRTDPQIPARLLNVESTHSLSTTYQMQDQAEPVWGEPGGPGWLGIVLPFDKIGGAATIAQLWVRIDRPEHLITTDPAERVRALRAWIDSLPTVPHVPLEALDRGELY